MTTVDIPVSWLAGLAVVPLLVVTVCLGVIVVGCIGVGLEFLVDAVRPDDESLPGRLGRVVCGVAAIGFGLGFLLALLAQAGVVALV